MKRNWIVWVICILLIAALCPVAASADGEHYDTSGSCGDNLTWSFDEATGTLTIAGTGKMDEYSIREDYSLEQHLPPWYGIRDSVKKIVLPDGLTQIGTDAFTRMSALTSVTIPNSVTAMGSYTFKNCTALKTVTIGSGLKSIPLQAFYGCTALQTITIPGNVNDIGNEAFSGCTALTSATLKNGVKIIGDKVFRNCTKLATISLPDSITETGESAFWNTAWRNNHENGLLYLNHCLIGYKDTYPENVVIQDGTKVLGAFALYGCIEMKSVKIPDSVTHIGKSAFNYCNKLTSITIPNSVTDIGIGAFTQCSALTSITIPDSVTNLGVQAFNNCTALKTVTLSKNITKIKGRQFYHCSSLESITIPDSVTEIEAEAFSGCTALRTVVIGDSVESIESKAFYQCSNIQSLTMPCRLNVCDEIICSTLTSVHFTAGNGIMRGYSEANYKKTPWYLSRNNALTVTLDDGITNIGDCAFRGCTGLTAITVPDSVTRIGSYAFSGCTGLTSFTIPDSVTDIGYCVFEGCTGLTSITIPDGLESIQNRVFFGTTALKAVTLGSNVKSISTGAFGECTELKDVYYKGTEAQRNEALPSSAIGSGNAYLVDAAWHYYPETVDVNADAISFGDDVLWKGATPYVIYNGSAQKPSVTVKDSSGNVINPFCYTVSYDANTQPGTARVTVAFQGGSGVTCSAWFKIYLPATANTGVANTENGIRIDWDAVEGAKGYVIYRRAWNLTSSGWTEFKRWNNTTGTTWTDTAVYAGTRYQYGVKAYFNDPMDNFNLGEVGPLKTTVRITTRSLLGVDAGKNEMTVRWSGSKYFTGYQIKYSTDPNFKNNVTAVKIALPDAYRSTIKNLTSGKTYYVTIRSYHVFEGMTYFGEWSNVISCKVN